MAPVYHWRGIFCRASETTLVRLRGTVGGLFGVHEVSIETLKRFACFSMTKQESVRS